MRNRYQDVPSFDGEILGRTESVPQAPRVVPLSEVEANKSGGGNRGGNQPLNGDASSSRMRGRSGNATVPPPVD
jgi:hypothetical protein